MKRALITGVAGQDGSYLAELLWDKGYEVHGTDISPSLPAGLSPRLASYAVLDLSAPNALADLVRRVRPREVYHLAAHHFSSQGDENRTGQLDAFVSVNLLAADAALRVMRFELPTTRFFYAASAHIFGAPEVCPQVETTPIRADNPYAISKSAGVQLCRYYRETHGLFTSVGIMYNHESPRRPASFVTTQIAQAAALAYVGRPEPLALHDLEALVDWGAAQDYVKAIRLTLQEPSGDDYIIASGVPRKVGDFADEAFSYLGLRTEAFVVQTGAARRTDRLPYIGDSSKIRKKCRWEPSITFRQLVRDMVDAQIQRLGGVLP